MAASVAATATATAAACGAARGGAPTESGCGGAGASRGAGRDYPGGASQSGRDGLLRGKGGQSLGQKYEHPSNSQSFFCGQTCFVRLCSYQFNFIFFFLGTPCIRRGRSEGLRDCLAQIDLLAFEDSDRWGSAHKNNMGARCVLPCAYYMMLTHPRIALHEFSSGT